MAGERISEIVGAVKSYTYLDQAPVQRIDVRKGSTTRWSSCVRSAGRRDPTLRAEPAGDRGLRFRAEPVWTNLVDNAVDAMDDAGRSTSTPTRRRTAASRSASATPVPASRPTCCRACSSRSSPPRRRAWVPAWACTSPTTSYPAMTAASRSSRRQRRGHLLHRHPPGQGGRAVRAGRGCRRAGSGGDGQDLTSPTTRLGSNDEKAGAIRDGGRTGPPIAALRACRMEGPQLVDKLRLAIAGDPCVVHKHIGPLDLPTRLTTKNGTSTSADRSALP